jgi:hypothetical protein
MTDKQQRPVLQAIANVMSAVGAVDKRGKNQFHGYEYATAGDIMHALQKRMATDGLVIAINQRRIEFIGNETVMLVEFGFDIQHTSGDRLDEPLVFSGMAGCKNKNGSFDDKAINKCLVGATKYFMLHLFKIPTGDYHDADADGEPVAPQNAPQSPPHRRQPPKAPQNAVSGGNGHRAADGAPRRDDEPFDDPLPPSMPDIGIEYVNAAGEVEDMPLDEGIARLRRAHGAPEAKLSNADWFNLYKSNEGWLTQHAPTVAAKLSARG